MTKAPGMEQVVGARCGSFGPEVMIIISFCQWHLQQFKALLGLVDDTNEANSKPFLS